MARHVNWKLILKAIFPPAISILFSFQVPKYSSPIIILSIYPTAKAWTTST